MKYLILLLTCFPLYSFGQNTPVKVYNRIDSITTTEQVQQFMREVTGCTNFFVKKDSMLSDGLHSFKFWEKVAADNDGYSILVLIAGYLWDYNKDGGFITDNYLLCVIDSGNNKFFYKWLAKEEYLHEHQKLPKFELIDSHTVIIVQRSLSFLDTIYFNKGRFIEYCSNPVCHKIAKIYFSTGMCRGPCPIFNIEIDSVGNAKLNEENTPFMRNLNADDSQEKKELKGKYHVTLDNSHFDSIMKLINEIDLANIESRYPIADCNGFVTVSDAPQSTLTISYNHGKVKEIYDEGEQGTLELKHLYELFFDLRKTQTWIKD